LIGTQEQEVGEDLVGILENEPGVSLVGKRNKEHGKSTGKGNRNQFPWEHGKKEQYLLKAW
jgi:hypothetical protein